MESFRWLVDATTIRSFENHEFGRSDFFRTDNYVLRLKPEGAKRLLVRLSEKFNSTIHYRGKAYRWDTITFLKAQELARNILHNVPFGFSEPSPDLRISDTLGLRKRILSLSQSEAKRLGIGKSSLHYLRGNARSDDSFKVYRKLRRKLE
jgi:CRISPR-associated protein Cas1